MSEVSLYRGACRVRSWGCERSTHRLWIHRLWVAACNPAVEEFPAGATLPKVDKNEVQGYLAHKKHTPRRTLQ